MLHPNAETRSLLSAWLTHQSSALPIVRHLLDRGEREHAEAIAAIAMKDPGCADREALAALLRPDGLSS